MQGDNNRTARPGPAAARRVAIKVGTRVLTDGPQGSSAAQIASLVRDAAAAVREGREVILISSGAVGLGQSALGLQEPVTELVDRQACAAVGQSRLMSLYQGCFAAEGMLCAQVLLTEADFEDRIRYLNLRGTLAALLRRGCIPIINENDVVSNEGLAYLEGDERPIFRDNDRLAALVASKLDAGLLILLTDVSGLYDRDPNLHPQAQLLERVDASDEDGVAALAGGPGPGGRGGMKSKVLAAAIAARAGAHAIIASGKDPNNLSRILNGEPIGSWFPARGALPARQRWIGYAAAPRGTLQLDQGAVEALRERGASLLAVGVCKVQGDFLAGDVVELHDPDGQLIGRGMCYCDAAEARLWRAGQRPAGARNHHALVHRDLLVLFPQVADRGDSCT